jgi:hypothetical protein
LDAIVVLRSFAAKGCSCPFQLPFSTQLREVLFAPRNPKH